jgi:hypothetical protein
MRTGTMGKADRRRAENIRQKLVAEQAAARRADVRRRTIAAGASVTAVAVLVVVIIAISLNRSPAPAAQAPAPAGTVRAVAREIADVPAAVFNRVGTGTASGLKAVTGAPELTAHGKPELLYMGGEFCPFCAAERWAIAAAVSRFGTLTGLHLIRSSPLDIHPDTATLSFTGARYASKYLEFVPVEWYGEQPDPDTPFGHVYLQHPTKQEEALFAEYSGGAIPFVDIGNRFLTSTQYSPSDLAGLTWAQIAAAMHDPGSVVSKDIDGAANTIAAGICKLTHDQPGGVCRSAGVSSASRST